MEKTVKNKRKFYIISSYAEILDIAMQLQYEGSEVVMSIPNHDYKTIGDGIVQKDDKWWNYIDGSWIFVVDGCEHGALQDYLRGKGVPVFGGSEAGDNLENNRQLGQKWFKSAGFYQPESANFKDISAAIKFVQAHPKQQWVLKQNADASKSINHVGKFEGNEDMVYHLEQLKTKWNEHEFGKFDCDLMEKVEGLEVAVSAFFNGKDFMKNKAGKVVAYINFEEKKQSEGGMGSTTGETGTTFLSIDEDNKIFKQVLAHPKILQVLRASKFRGVFDINCIQTKKGMVALEPTCRPGIPGSSYEFIEGLDMPTGDMLEAVAKGQNTPIELHPGVGMVLVVAAKPFPVEATLPPESTSVGERLWILKDGKPVKEMEEEQKKHIHLQNFKKENGDFVVATSNGYLLTTTLRGKSIKEVQKSLVEYTKDNLYIPDMVVRHDIGERVIKFYAKK